MPSACKLIATWELVTAFLSACCQKSRSSNIGSGCANHILMTISESNGALRRVVSYATRKVFTQPSLNYIVSVEAHFVFSVATKATNRQIVKSLYNGKRKILQRVRMCNGLWPIQKPAQIVRSRLRKIKAAITWRASLASINSVGFAWGLGPIMVKHREATISAINLMSSKRTIKSKRKCRRSKMQSTSCRDTFFTTNGIIIIEKLKATRKTCFQISKRKSNFYTILSTICRKSFSFWETLVLL